MSNFEDDDLDEGVEGNEEPVEAVEAPSNGNNRNFLLALGVLGGIFLLLIIGLVILFLSRGKTDQATNAIRETNGAILLANTQTAGAATQVAILMLTPSATQIPTETSVPPTVTRTRVVALATATNTLAPGAAQGLFTATPSAAPKTTATPANAQTQSAGLTKTMAANLTATATKLPTTGFAEDVGLPGLFGMAIGLVLVIVLVRRLRLSPSH